MTDMGKALALAPVAAATKVADGRPASALFLADGDTFHVPPGVSLLWDVTDSPRLKWLRVDGTLTVDPDVDVSLLVDTLVTGMGSTFSLDYTQGAGSFRCVFTGGPMDLTDTCGDPMRPSSAVDVLLGRA